VALLEIGADQADAMRDAVRGRLAGWTCEIEPDLSGAPRVARVFRAAEAG
jgi:hypothetical protein